MDEKEWKEKWELYRQFARKRGYGYLSEDFAQSACEEMLKGRKLIPKYYLIDFLRRYQTDLRNKYIPHFQEFRDQGWKDEVINPTEIISFLDKRQVRAVVVLFIKWGFSMKEIGELFDLTESRICQVIKIFTESASIRERK